MYMHAHLYRLATEALDPERQLIKEIYERPSFSHRISEHDK